MHCSQLAGAVGFIGASCFPYPIPAIHASAELEVPFSNSKWPGIGQKKFVVCHEQLWTLIFRTPFKGVLGRHFDPQNFIVSIIVKIVRVPEINFGS